MTLNPKVLTGWLAAVVLLTATTPFGAHAAAQATKPPPKKAAASTPAKPKNSIARDPYLGAIAIDAATGRVLFEDQADAKAYPASTLKLMNLLIVLETIQQGRLSLQDTVTVSARAAKVGGSQVWLAEKEVFTVDELLYALMVQSANDAALALSEKVAGTPEVFVDLMNQRARALGMTNTVFHSVHGLPPAAGQEHDVTTARDFARLCREVLRHPDTLRYTSTRERPFRPNVAGKTVVMRTHNHLLGAVEGCDGLKTGYFLEAGYSLAATATRQGQRVIVVVVGSVDRKVRDTKATELLAKAFLALPPAPAVHPATIATNPLPTRPKK
jgi:D-alanyl-D-alanine carboxypeptidase (penicillin-binding protein 5/6)